MKKRILFLIDSLSTGGAERQLTLLVKYLPQAWKTRVVSLGGGQFYQALLDQGTSVAVYQRQSRFDLIAVFRLFSEILRYKPDIIHSWGWLSSALIAPICKIRRILLIDGSLRIAGPDNRHYWRRRVAFSLADHIIANSHAGLAAYQAPGGKSSVIYNAIDPERLTLVKRQATSWDNVTKVIMTGRISPFKDFATYFEAARRLNEQEPGCWKFVAIGSGQQNDWQKFAKLAEDLVGAGVMELPQAGLEVLPYLKESNIGVLLSAASFKEGFSNSIMEYMACKLPVICSDSGGNSELVIDGETGFIIPPEDVETFIEKLLFLKNHHDISDKMGLMGYKRIVSMCSIERMISEYELLYKGLLEKKTKTVHL